MARLDGLGLATFNALPDDRAEDALLACCSSRRWARAVLGGRPYRSVDEVLRASDAALAELAETDIDDALAGHPRIGERASPAHSAWSLGEQAGVATAADATRAALAAANREYERRFGHVYLVYATGKSADELLAILNERLEHDAATERRVARTELGKINRNRLERLLAEGTRRLMSTVTTHVLDTSRGRPASGVAVQLEGLVENGTRVLAQAVTDDDGRIAEFGRVELPPGPYRLVFETGSYFAARGEETFYPRVTVEFSISDPRAHYHVPLLVSPFGLTTYRGS